MRDSALDFNQRVVLVTGASQGIGQATAVAFAKHGATVVVNYHRNDTGAQETERLINATGGKCLLKKADVGDAEQACQMVESIEEQLGAIDVLVNNAAAFSRSHFLQTSLDELDEVFRTNVRGLYHLSQLVARRMVPRRYGSIIHVSSILAQHAVPNRTVYCASKGAVESLTRAMALDLVAYNIRVNAVAPGLIRTDAMLAGFTNPVLLDEVQKHIPGGRFGESEEIANVILFLASDLASYITGEVVDVSHGLGAREAGPASQR